MKLPLKLILLVQLWNARTKQGCGVDIQCVCAQQITGESRTGEAEAAAVGAYLGQSGVGVVRWRGQVDSIGCKNWSTCTQVAAARATPVPLSLQKKYSAFIKEI